MKEYKKEKLISFFLCLLVIPFLNQLMHWSQTKDCVYKRPLLRTTFSCFKKEFEKVDWIWKDNHPDSLFTEKFQDAMFHASIIQLNESGYILTTWGYMQAKKLKRQKIIELRKSNGQPKYRYEFC